MSPRAIPASRETSADVERRLADLLTVNPQIHALMLSLRAQLRALIPTAAEQVKFGGLLYVLEQPVCGLFAYKAHVSLEFGQGARLPDPQGLLLGQGTYRRHLRFDDAAAVDAHMLAEFVRDAAALPVV